MNIKKIIVVLWSIGIISNVSAATVIDPANIAQSVVNQIKTSIEQAAHWAKGMASDKAIAAQYHALEKKVLSDLSQKQENKIQGVMTNQEIMIAQADKQVRDTDVRNSQAIGRSQIAAKDDASRPTVAQCIEESKGAYKASAIGASFGGSKSKGAGGSLDVAKGPGTLAQPDPEVAMQKIVNASSVYAEPLKNKPMAQTCNKMYNIKGCTADTYQDADRGINGIKSNTNKNQLQTIGEVTVKVIDSKGVEHPQKVEIKSPFSNWSLDKNGQLAAKSNIVMATVNESTPKSYADNSLWDKNRIYMAMYNQVIGRIGVAVDTLTEVVNFRAESDVKSMPPEVSSKWKNNEAKYHTIFPTLKFPKLPSMYELVNFDVHKDYIGISDAETAALTPDAVQKEISRKLSLSNYIAWKQYNVQENTNIILSHMLVQAVTPLDINKINSEYVKTNVPLPATK